jgi:small subunit ribosomal protein S4
MARNLSPKCKLCRRAGEKLFLKGDRCDTPKCAFVRRSYPPGAHGSKRKRPPSGFGEQLAMKQKAKRIYSVMERQLKTYFNEVSRKSGVTGDLLLQKLEMRLDNVVFRAGFAKSRALARQLVRHSFFTLNGKNANIPSIEVKSGDIIKMKENKKTKEYSKQLAEILKGKEVAGAPAWLDVNGTDLSIGVKSKPAAAEISEGIDAQMIVESYSR